MKVIASSMIPQTTAPWAFYVSLFALLLSTANGFAAIPLITDDTGTQGKGKFQLELFGEYGHDKEERITIKNSNVASTLTYGIIDPVDIIVSIPYQFWRSEDPQSMTKGDGISDIAIESKWRFYEKEGLSIALKPGFTIPTGDEEKGLGAGRATYCLYFVASREMNPWAFHLNLAYIRNENKEDERKDIWHASLASAVDVMKNLKLAVDTGVESNPDSLSSTPAAYILGGVIYSLRENLDIGLGLKSGLTKAETDIAVRGGITWRF
ncbi:MAG: transporter [Nitrospirae bacterium]|nr:transporter [Nitrospirota bacterium]